MGSCFGRCLTSSSSQSSGVSLIEEDAPHKNQVESSLPSPSINFIYRIMKSKRTSNGRSSKFLERFWANQDMRYTRLKPKPTTVQPATSDSDADIPLQCLDAQLLLAQGRHISDATVNPSPASSSLDLEWEHEEYRAHQTEQHSWLMLPEDSDITTSSSSGDSSDSSSRKQMLVRPVAESTRSQAVLVSKNGSRASSGRWSHRSTPDSLEWDVNDADHQRFQSNEDLLDPDTMELLQEIEWLKNRALSETGEGCRAGAIPVEAES